MRDKLATAIWYIGLGCIFAAYIAIAWAQSEAQKEARRQAIRRGAIPPEVVDGVLITPDQPRR
jgi:hypothetical protein